MAVYPYLLIGRHFYQVLMADLVHHAALFIGSTSR